MRDTALMMATAFPDACIDGVEIELRLGTGSGRKHSCSPWADRLQVHHASFRHYLAKNKYDLIINQLPIFTGL